MTKGDLELRIYILNQELRELKHFYEKWKPLALAMENIIHNQVEERLDNLH